VPPHVRASAAARGTGQSSLRKCIDCKPSVTFANTNNGPSAGSRPVTGSHWTASLRRRPRIGKDGAGTGFFFQCPNRLRSRQTPFRSPLDKVATTAANGASINRKSQVFQHRDRRPLRQAAGEVRHCAGATVLSTVPQRSPQSTDHAGDFLWKVGELECRFPEELQRRRSKEGIFARSRRLVHEQQQGQVAGRF
jgi:hypothetical protein